MVNDNECDYYDTFLAPFQKVSFVTLHFQWRVHVVVLFWPLQWNSSFRRHPKSFETKFARHR